MINSLMNEFDEQDLLERVMGNEELARRVASRFIEGAPRQLSALAEAVGRADAEATRCLAHGIKGSASNVGGIPLSEVASHIERLAAAGDLNAAAHILPELSAHFEKLRCRLQAFCPH
jgi:HPt (histidine-containing phosphotransfer) domain-containing protein